MGLNSNRVCTRNNSLKDQDIRDDFALLDAIELECVASMSSQKNMTDRCLVEFAVHLPFETIVTA